MVLIETKSFSVFRILDQWIGLGSAMDKSGAVLNPGREFPNDFIICTPSFQIFKSTTNIFIRIINDVKTRTRPTTYYKFHLKVLVNRLWHCHFEASHNKSCKQGSAKHTVSIQKRVFEYYKLVGPKSLVCYWNHLKNHIVKFLMKIVLQSGNKKHLYKWADDSVS